MNSQNKIKIGVFDSGIGGLSIVKELLTTSIPLVIYYLPNQRINYGNLMTHQIIHHSLNQCAILNDLDVNSIVVACNTSTVAGIQHYRSHFSVPFVGVEPYVNAINREDFLKDLDSIGLLVTKATADSQRLKYLLKKYDPFKRIKVHVLPELAKTIEEIYANEGPHQGHFKMLEEQFHEVKKQDHSALILGCTHYPLIQDWIEEFTEIPTISPGKYVARQLNTILNFENQSIDTSDKELHLYDYMGQAWQRMAKEKVDLCW